MLYSARSMISLFSMHVLQRNNYFGLYIGKQRPNFSSLQYFGVAQYIQDYSFCPIYYLVPGQQMFAFPRTIVIRSSFCKGLYENPLLLLEYYIIKIGTQYTSCNFCPLVHSVFVHKITIAHQPKWTCNRSLDPKFLCHESNQQILGTPFALSRLEMGAHVQSTSLLFWLILVNFNNELLCMVVKKMPVIGYDHKSPQPTRNTLVEVYNQYMSRTSVNCFSYLFHTVMFSILSL